MDVCIKKGNQIAPVVLQRLGYAQYVNKEGEQSFVRRLQGTNFPRFHVYISAEDNDEFHCTLHLDQKRPSYQGTNAHGGDYDSDVVQEEAQRLENG